MAITDKLTLTGGPAGADALLMAYKVQLRDRLTEQLMPVAKEVVRAAVKDALDSLEVQIETAFHEYSRELVVKLSINDKDVPR